MKAEFIVCRFPLAGLILAARVKSQERVVLVAWAALLTLLHFSCFLPAPWVWRCALISGTPANS